MLFRAVSLVSLVALIVSIVGNTQNNDITHGLVNTETQVALVLFLVTWVGACILFLLIANRSQSIEDGEHRLLLAVGISLPLILVRLIYSFIYTFGHKAEFSMLSGNVTIQLVMSVLEEIVITLVCLGIGLTLQVRRDPEYSHQPSVSDGRGDSIAMENDGYQEPQARRMKTQRPKRGGGPLYKLVMFIVDEIRDRRK
jgi:uncharacterized membrane protein